MRFFTGLFAAYPEGVDFYTDVVEECVDLLQDTFSIGPYATGVETKRADLSPLDLQKEESLILAREISRECHMEVENQMKVKSEQCYKEAKCRFPLAIIMLVCTGIGAVLGGISLIAPCLEWIYEKLAARGCFLNGAAYL